MELPPLLLFLLARPFEPFDICLVDGRRVSVSHPESAVVYLGGLGIWISLPSGQIEFINGNAVASFRSAGVADSTNFILQDE